MCSSMRTSAVGRLPPRAFWRKIPEAANTEPRKVFNSWRRETRLRISLVTVGKSITTHLRRATFEGGFAIRPPDPTGSPVRTRLSRPTPSKKGTGPLGGWLVLVRVPVAFVDRPCRVGRPSGGDQALSRPDGWAASESAFVKDGTVEGARQGPLR